MSEDDAPESARRNAREAAQENDLDDTLERALRRAAAVVDPVPVPLLQSAIEAYALSTLDAELAELTFDSLTQGAAVRGAEHPRLLTFQGAGLTLDLEIATGRLVGQVLPAQPAEIDLLGGPARSLTTDALGRFACDEVPAGPLSLRCRAGGREIVTEWLTVFDPLAPRDGG